MKKWNEMDSPMAARRLLNEKHAEHSFSPHPLSKSTRRVEDERRGSLVSVLIFEQLTSCWRSSCGVLGRCLPGVAALFLATRPAPASLAMLAGGVIGFVSINLFYINTLYGLAIPLWLIGAALVLIAARTPASGAVR